MVDSARQGGDWATAQSRASLSAVEISDEMIEAGVSVYHWWESDEFSEWYENSPTVENQTRVLVREIWSAMRVAQLSAKA
jgi:hypothetical protein